MKTNLIYFLIVINLCFFSAEGLSQETSVPSNEISIDTTLTQDSSNVEPRRFNNLKERYTEDAFNYERTKETSGWWTRFKQWLSDLWQSLFNIDSKGEAAQLTDVMLNIASVIIILLVVYFIYRAIINKEGKWVFGKSSNKTIIPVDAVETNIHETNFETLISSAESELQYRLAIRYYYLWLLKELTRKGLIEYDAEKTNSDYQLELTNHTQAEKFAYTSYLYNYIWYGEFTVDEIQFSKAKKAFIHFLNSIKNG
ncbi:DUF4129 domain-containing protein [Aurantibacter aestuarii]|uniref:DUF4129 domain-containing protein n=1 Tax=Aurantibacter aestuarii TaxID=1266046 RepID=A0A2T1N571_9FLAO|nr:DUF4129 domain-containing protein [Aurantibacter aestuarii]PSG86431.1 DUF4129 domain-containing protein [Aurantibacter aestuarii]